MCGASVRAVMCWLISNRAGIIVYMMIVGTLPFTDLNESNTVFRILDVKYIVPDWATDGFRDLVARVLVRCGGDCAIQLDLGAGTWSGA